MKIHHLAALLILPAGTYLLAQDAITSDGGATDTPPDATAPADPALADQPPASEEDGPAVPIAYDSTRYDSVWGNNPFTRKVISVPPPGNTWGNDWALAGMMQYKDTVRISIRNKQTNEIKRVTKEPKEGEEFRLIKANFNRSRKEASAVIAKGNDEATLKYDENAAPVTINNTARPAGAVQGQPGKQPAGMINGQPMINKPVSPTANGRVFNAPNIQGGVSQGGMAPGAVNMTPNMSGAPNAAGVQSGVVNPAIPGTAGLPNNGNNIPTISRRRQLIPAPVVNPPQSNP